MSSQKKHGNGFSLVGVLVAAGIMGFLAVVFSQMISNSQKGQKSVENSIDFDILRSSIQLVLNKPSLCGAAFKNSDTTDPIARFHPTTSIPTDKKLHSIFMGSSKIAEVGMNLGGGLTITKLELEFIPPPLPPAPPPPPNNYEVNLIVEASKASGAYGGYKLSNASNPFRFSIQTSSSDEIVGCNPTKVIRCDGEFSTPQTGNHKYVFKFSPSQCGGFLPFVGCQGVLTHFQACYSGSPTFQVLNSGESGPHGATTVSGPGISAYAYNLCAWSSGPYSGKTAVVGALYLCP